MIRRSITTATLALLMLAGCEEETLSVGELRCHGVRCAGHDFDEVQVGGGRNKEPEVTELADTASVEIVELPRAEDEPDGLVSIQLVPIEREGEMTPLIAGLIRSADASSLWVGRYDGGEWREQRISPRDMTEDGSAFFSIAAGPADEPGEAIVALADQPTLGGSQNVRVFRFTADDDLELLFDVAGVGALHGVMEHDGDILLLDAFQDMYEVTRHAADGAIRWRQTRLLADHTVEMATGVPGITTVARAQLRAIDEEHVAMLLPIASLNEFEVTVVDDAGAVAWSYRYFTNTIHLGAELRITRDDDLMFASDGYVVQRAELRDGAVRMSTASRHRTKYYELALHGMDVADSGWTYVAILDGLADERVTRIERLSPDFERIESILVAGDPLCEELAGVSLGSTGTRALFDFPANRMFVATRLCFAIVTLPELEP